MGVYHLMGLGRSPGAVIGPISYLAHRYRRWSAEDREFFERSGEAEQRKRGERVGDIQAMVLFSSPEVIDGYDAVTGRPFVCYPYIDNRAGTCTGDRKEGAPMKEVLARYLPRELSQICGGRPTCTIFWCKVNRRDIRTTYERVARTVAALARVGERGKEMWVNLTGGNNVINLSLELAATLSGRVSRLYYVQAHDQQAEKCLRYTAEDGYWVEIPIMPLAIPRAYGAILRVLQEHGELPGDELWSRVVNQPEWIPLLSSVKPEDFRNEYLDVLWKVGMVEGEGGRWRLTERWNLIRQYQDVWEAAKADTPTLEQLAEREEWLERMELKVK